MTFTVLGDIMSPRERSRYTGFFTAVFASASVIGPLVGGFFVDNLSWRWVFYVNLPLGVLCMFVVGRYLLVPAPTERRTIDLVGAALLTIGVTSLLLAAAWGGQDHAWGSPLILMLIAGGATVIVVFILFERRHPEPILPLRMFRDRVFTVCVAMARSDSTSPAAQVTPGRARRRMSPSSGASTSIRIATYTASPATEAAPMRTTASVPEFPPISLATNHAASPISAPARQMRPRLVQMSRNAKARTFVCSTTSAPAAASAYEMANDAASPSTP